MKRRFRLTIYRRRAKLGLCSTPRKRCSLPRPSAPALILTEGALNGAVAGDTEAPQAAGTPTISREAAKPTRPGRSWCGRDRVCFGLSGADANVCGRFRVGAVIIQDMQLTYVVQGAAKVEAAAPGAGVPWASSQLQSPAAFVATTAPCGAQITGQWPVTLGVFPALTLSAQACSPK